jgi:Asp-tRNA(Asn)/Glu-tRNA(Gln) amidotransferase A subunit family amidase
MRVPAEEPMMRAIEDTVARLRASGVQVDALDPPEGWRELVDATRDINQYEGACTHAERYREFGERLGARLAELIRAGLSMSTAEYEAARAHVAEMRARMAPLWREYPLLLSPAATGPAPAGYASTGDPSNNAPWTALGVPAISVAMPGPGAPMGLQLTAARGADDRLVQWAKQIEDQM